MTNPIMKFFKSDHLPSELAVIATSFHALAMDMEAKLPDSAEKSAGLRKLLEAKDCFVRAAADWYGMSPGARRDSIESNPR